MGVEFAVLGREKVRKILLTILIITMFVVIGVFTKLYSDKKEIKMRADAYSLYRVAMFDQVLEGGDGYNLYKGMIYEYGLGREKNIELAIKYYKSLEDSALSNKRLFLICFLYCEDKLGLYYSKSKDVFGIVSAIYSAELINSRKDCGSIVSKDVCGSVQEFVEFPNENLFYNVAKRSNEILIERKSHVRDFEVVYYLLMKSHIIGNDNALTYMENIPDEYFWLPR